MYRRGVTWHRLRLPPLALVVAASMLGCGDRDGLPARHVEVHIRDGGLDPPLVRLQVPGRATLRVVNDTRQACDFHFGAWVRSLAVPADDHVGIEFAMPAVDAQPWTPVSVTMGCTGRDQMSGRIAMLADPAR